MVLGLSGCELAMDIKMSLTVVLYLCYYSALSVLNLEFCAKLRGTVAFPQVSLVLNLKTFIFGPCFISLKPKPQKPETLAGNP